MVQHNVGLQTTVTYRLTPPSRPNKAGLNVCQMSMKFDM